MVAVYYMYYERPFLSLLTYGLSELLDAADGYFARKLNQCSKFGQVLDMVTDRCTTTCLLATRYQLTLHANVLFANLWECIA
ncbi:CDP-diacylglycerol-inositol 3-phosphatidyltransferase [Zancudomyces culisetae]|uniref:CDP-diacylglycerol-inositol 3-phosphatidyltransferase n=1 Tax=Zancudomyces culisetae TaxID=1213189 RepID=A0A1R1PP63_ZANCU|nr:CDP-diacylglycerol-inositol 3-phosphatidyltransferase [Zancudomyces culisetae]OMH84036.1 CDP-diacylglycerol-inositol 3-phosphatidyltransferase [Zancudomyces culisetae]|eukprot:OMH82693.1 CDP-diacylglycerol-inositol 3-phosphatidyltransferase [Zancudomyces culisetae]